MRIFFFVLGCLSLAALYADSFDSAADELIYEQLRSNEFSNTEIIYLYEGQEYPIQIVHNPQREVLWGLRFASPLFHSLIMVGDLPLPLQHHIGEISAKLVNSADSFLNLAGNFFDLSGHAAAEVTKDLAPVYMANQIDDPEIEKTIKDLFRSPTFVTQVFYYCINSKYYRIRLLVNPEGRLLVAKRPWTARVNGEKISGVSLVYWERKYGIIVDRQCPKEFTNYLSHLAGASCWDWYTNFEISEGLRVQYDGYQEPWKLIGRKKIVHSELWFNCAHYLE